MKHKISSRMTVGIEVYIVAGIEFVVESRINSLLQGDQVLMFYTYISYDNITCTVIGSSTLNIPLFLLKILES